VTKRHTPGSPDCPDYANTNDPCYDLCTPDRCFAMKGTDMTEPLEEAKSAPQGPVALDAVPLVPEDLPPEVWEAVKANYHTDAWLPSPACHAEYQDARTAVEAYKTLVEGRGAGSLEAQNARLFAENIALKNVLAEEVTLRVQLQAKEEEQNKWKHNASFLRSKIVNLRGWASSVLEKGVLSNPREQTYRDLTAGEADIIKYVIERLSREWE